MRPGRLFRGRRSWRVINTALSFLAFVREGWGRMRDFDLTSRALHGPRLSEARRSAVLRDPEATLTGLRAALRARHRQECALYALPPVPPPLVPVKQISFRDRGADLAAFFDTRLGKPFVDAPRYFRPEGYWSRGVVTGYRLNADGTVDELLWDKTVRRHPSMDKDFVETWVGYGLLVEVKTRPNTLEADFAAATEPQPRVSKS